MYEIDARRMERAFVRRIRKTRVFTTANGKANIFIGRSQDAIQLQTERSRKPLSIFTTKLRAAIQFTFYRKTVTRKDLEPFSRYSSALLGILHVIFDRIAKFHRSPSGLVRLTLKGLRYFFAGADRSKRDLEVAASQGAKFVLLSYAYVRKGTAWLRHVIRLGLKVLLDSGAFTIWKAARNAEKRRANGLLPQNPRAPIRIEEYASFIEMHRQHLFAWFNLDVVGDPETSRRNALYLKGRGLAPLEVWHVGSDLAELDRLVAEDHALIGIGGSVGLSEAARRRAFSEVFERHPHQNFHFLGGASRLLLEFDWFSADSTGWLIGRKYGLMIDENGQRHGDRDGLVCLAYNVSYFLSLEKTA